MPESAEERAPERKKLEAFLESGLRTIFEGLTREMPGEVIKPVTAGEQVKAAVESSRPDQRGFSTKVYGLGGE